MKKATIFVLLLALQAPVSFAADDDAAERKDPNAPTYQSPILSLLFLPVNLLIKMASVMGPSTPDRSTTSRTAPTGSDK